ncbi:MAG: VOC family protein [Halobacteriales archaeon]|nr:VOC family protein [Halobacteriales archaeon]
MPTRPPIAPSVVCTDVDKTYEYFTEVLGFAGTGKWAGPDGSTMHAMVVMPTKFGDAHVMFGPAAALTSGAFGDAGAFGENVKNSPETLGNGVVLWFNVPDVDKYHAFVKTKGATIDEAPKDQFWGDRTMSVLAPDGYYLTFSSPIKGFATPPGMGERDSVGATQAKAPLTKKIKIPGLPAAKKKAASKKKR